MSFLRTILRTPVARPAQSHIRPVTQIVFRTYASSSSEKGSPTTTPQSDSPDEQRIKQKTTSSKPEETEQGGSTAEPVSGKGDVTGQSEEGGDPQKDGVGRDSKPLDAADKK